MQCVATSMQDLVGAGVTESYLGLAESQQRAVVQIVNDPASKAPLCSGVFVTPEWVATAAHCLAISPTFVLINAGAGGPSSAVPVSDAQMAPSLDLALLRADFGAPNAVFGDGTIPDPPPKDALDLGVRPIPFGATASTNLAIGDAVELAGYGLTEAMSSNELRFLVETLVAMDATSVQVDGFGASGACDGDSGGPLLVRDRNGQATTVAVLSTGSSLCSGKDSYVLLARAADWLESTLGSHAIGADPCGSIDVEGRCLFGSAVRCADGALTAERCSPSEPCGWDAGSASVRCSSRTGCAGVDSVGQCLDHAAVTCQEGATVVVPCAPCGTCRVAGTTGVPYCASF